MLLFPEKNHSRGAFACLTLRMGFAAQDPPKPPGVSTHLNLGLSFAALNRSVGNLTKDDFVVVDRGQSQEIRVFSTQSSPPTAQPAQPLLHNTYS